MQLQDFEAVVLTCVLVGGVHGWWGNGKRKGGYGASTRVEAVGQYVTKLKRFVSIEKTMYDMYLGGRKKL